VSEGELVTEFEHAIDIASHQRTDVGAIVSTENPRPTHIVVRMYLPEESPPLQHSVDQANSARAEGCTVGAYLWAYRDLDPRKSVRNALALAKQCGMDPPPVMWIDCETYARANGTTDPGPDADWLRQAIDECRQLGARPGFYTAEWWWRGYLGNTTEFADIPLWTAQYDHIANPNSVGLYGGFGSAAGKQWNGTGLDRDVFFKEFTTSEGLTQRATLKDLRATNPNIYSQLRIWQKDQVVQGKDPYDYQVFRQFQVDIGAPDPGGDEFIGFHRPRIEELEQINPNIARQLIDWQVLHASDDPPVDYEAFRIFQTDIFAPDPGEAEFIGFLRPGLGELESRNPNIRSQLEAWRKLRSDQNLDPMDYQAFRQFQIAIGAPDPCPWEPDGFRALS
jgi:Glycosyl hydrolases family 25